MSLLVDVCICHCLVYICVVLQGRFGSYEYIGCVLCCFFFQAEDGIRDAQESRGLGDVYKRQVLENR